MKELALLQAILLHVLLAVGMIVFGRLTPPVEPVIYLNFEMLEPAADPAPGSQQDQENAAPNPAPVSPKPVQPAPVKVQPVIPAPKKVSPVHQPAPKPAPVPVSINPAPEKPEAQDTPEPGASSSSGLDAQTTPAAPAQGQVSDAGAKEDAGGAAMRADEQYRRANFRAIRDTILGNLHYPMLARRRGWSGQVELSFTIDPDGSVSGLKVLTSSGYPVLDEQARTAIRSSAPFTPPPPRAVELVMPVTFRLN